MSPGLWVFAGYIVGTVGMMGALLGGQWYRHRRAMNRILKRWEQRERDPKVVWEEIVRRELVARQRRKQGVDAP